MPAACPQEVLQGFPGTCLDARGFRLHNLASLSWSASPVGPRVPRHWPLSTTTTLRTTGAVPSLCLSGCPEWHLACSTSESVSEPSSRCEPMRRRGRRPEQEGRQEVPHHRPFAARPAPRPRAGPRRTCRDRRDPGAAARDVARAAVARRHSARRVRSVTSPRCGRCGARARPVARAAAPAPPAARGDDRSAPGRPVPGGSPQVRGGIRSLRDRPTEHPRCFAPQRAGERNVEEPRSRESRDGPRPQAREAWRPAGRRDDRRDGECRSRCCRRGARRGVRGLTTPSRPCRRRASRSARPQLERPAAGAGRRR